MTFADLHADALAVMRTWVPDSPAQESLRQAYIAYLTAIPEAMERSCAPGHLTASAVVVDRSRNAALLTLHPRIGRWVQLGGHCEADDGSLRAAVAGGARGGDGIQDLLVGAEPLQLDVHPLTCSGGVPTRHLDVRYLVVVPDGSEAVISEESDDLRWFPFDALPDGLDPATRTLIEIAAVRV